MDNRDVAAEVELRSLREAVLERARHLRESIERVEREVASGRRVNAGAFSTATENYFIALGRLAGYQAALALYGKEVSGG